MLSPTEKSNVAEILDLVSDKDILSLAETITNRLVRVETRKDAIEAVCSYATSVQDVLRRKKVKKDVIFSFLRLKNVAVNPASDKLQLMNAVLQMWSLPVCQEIAEVEIPMDEATPSNTPILNGHTTTSVSTNNMMQQMGETFVTWFYQVMNSVCPGSTATQTTDKFGPHHFWHDCRLRVDLRSSTDQFTHQCTSAEEVAKCLGELVRCQGFLFNPHVTTPGSVNVSVDPHGLVKVVASGVIHTQVTCVGMFKQLFGLVQDIKLQNNWKIKFTELQGTYVASDKAVGYSEPNGFAVNQYPTY